MSNSSRGPKRDATKKIGTTPKRFERDTGASRDRSKETNFAKHIGVLKGKIEIKGDIFSTGHKDR